MPSFSEFAITQDGVEQVTVPKWTVSGKVTNTAGDVIQDFTGGNAQDVAIAFGKLSTSQQQHILSPDGLGLGQYLLSALAGQEQP